MRKMLGALSLLFVAPVAMAQSVFINEIHYDNVGTDAGEAIEVAGPAGMDLTGWSIVLYNGSGGASYDTDALSGTLPDNCGGLGTMVLTYAVNGIQNGNPDGLALVDDMGTVIQFLSYEGTFTATNGPANGMLSVDIGQAEGSATPAGFSLQLSGSGSDYTDFTWQPEGASTFGACNTGQTFVAPDTTPPTVLSSTLASANPTNAASVDFTVTFSESVTGVDTSDFAVTPFFGLSGASVTGVSGSGDTYTVTVNTGTGDGDLRLDVLDDDSIIDGASNPLAGGFTGGDIYTIDKTGPTVTINQAGGQADPTSTSPILFSVVFSESVSNFTTGDVTLSGTAGATTAAVSGSGTTYTVSVSGMTANGTVTATVPAAAASDTLGNPSAMSTSTDNTVTFNDPAPTVSSIVRANADPTGAGSVSWTVTFSESVTGVDSGDFALVNGGLTGPSISGVSGSGASYTVTADTGSGTGTLGLNVVDNDSIVDSFANPLGGAGAGNGDATGEVYTVDASVPTVVSITPSGSTDVPSGATVSWTVVFSEAVTGVDASDFNLVFSFPLAGGMITGVSGSGTTWTVTAFVGNGRGSLNLALVDDDSIIDALNNPLGGVGAGNGSAQASQVFSVGGGASAIPTLSQYGLALLIGLTLLVGGMQLRRPS
ncbi:MAG: IPTL-CTERM sorting domain-containing protein [Xanthomonadales bacterium]|nr:IPTL-CTERM sorting domain-containing protein [Xanthomonadales bacterium]